MRTWRPLSRIPTPLSKHALLMLRHLNNMEISWVVSAIFVLYSRCRVNPLIVPPILLASFALQESSCNPNTIGGAGEQGLMQITKEKCAGAPGGNCLDPWFNIMTGAQYFANTLKANHGDLLKSIGSYNGWFKGMTYVSASTSIISLFVHSSLRMMPPQPRKPTVAIAKITWTSACIVFITAHIIS